MDDNAIYHFHQAQMWMSVKEYEAAILEYQIAIRLKPTTTLSSALYNDLGLAYLKVKEYPKAIVSFQEAIALNPNFSLYYENLVNAYSHSGALLSAAQQLDEATLTNPDNFQAWFILGLLYKAQGDKVAAQSAFQTYLKLAPNSELADAAKINLTGLKDSQTR
jgi:tetratricopeptide (TPR) repeat protein